MVHFHDKISGNCVRLMLGDMEPLHIGMSASHFCSGTRTFFEQINQTLLHSSLLKDHER